MISALDSFLRRLGRHRFRDLEERVAYAVELAEGALHGNEGRRRIWTDGDYLTAILALLTEDGDRAREASLAAARRESA